MNEDQVRYFLERYGQAISEGDLATISSCWEVPALVLSDQGAIAVSEVGEIESFFAQGSTWYRSQGLVATRPELERVEALSEKMASVDVRWPSFDETGAEKYSEHSHYILRIGDDEQPRIRVALNRTG